ncbi:MAG: flagellar motor protein [Acidobacteria bacterium]|nr:MAG: flagellar motor protein [Acidobacteriota bacterium]
MIRRARAFSRRRPDEGRASGPGQHRWIVSYADFITLLFAFFTALYGISTIDAAKFGSAVNGLQSAFAGGTRPGPLPGARADAPAANPPAPAAPPSGARPLAVLPPADPAPAAPGQPAEVSLDDVRARLRDRLDGPVRQGRVALDLDPRGLVVSIRESGSFATGSAEVSPGARAGVAEVAAAVREVGNLVRVEGHTDDVPMHTPRYGSNWELSTARATRVVALLVGVHAIDPSRLSAAGYSEYHPRAPNDSDANRARNRRVDVVILDPRVSNREEPGQRTRPS